MKMKCTSCHKEFLPNSKKQRYCSYSCSGSANARLGKVTPAATRFWAKVRKTKSCWLWIAGLGRGGYGKFGVRGNRTVAAHRYAYETQIGPIPDGLLVCHDCDNHLCVRPSHLFLGTHKDNTQDAIKKGRFASGNRHPSCTRPEYVRRGEAQNTAKLTAVKVAAIRKRPADNQSLLANEFGVSQALISRVLLRKCWKHLP